MRSARRCSFLFCLPLSAALLGAYAAQAQQPAAAPQALRNVVRLDLATVLYRNLDYNFLNSRPQLLLPLLVGYERQLSGRVSGTAEVVLNGGSPATPLWGFTLQGRYYLASPWRGTPLSGFYVAPLLGFRRVQARYPGDVAARSLGGAGVLVGVQLPVGRHLRLDASVGTAAWGRLSAPSAPPDGSYQTYVPSTFYERDGLIPDGRLSVGYAF